MSSLQMKQNFKLPKEVSKNCVVAAFSTIKKLTIEGYRGAVALVSHESEVPEGALLCRPGNGTKGTAWVQVKNKGK